MGVLCCGLFVYHALHAGGSSRSPYCVRCVRSDVCDMGMPRERVKALLLCATVGCLDMLDRIPIECKKYDGDGVKCMAQCLIIHYSASSVMCIDAG